MEVVVDGKTGLVTPDEGTTLRAIFEALKRTVASRRRLIVALTLDGELLSPERQGVLSSDAPGKFRLLEVRTVDPFEFSARTLTGLIAHLKNIEKNHDEAAQYASKGEYAKTLEKAEACFHGWDILLRAVRDVSGMISADLKNLDAGGAPVDARIRELQDALLRLSAAMEFKDVARIAEMVQGEFRPRLGDWRAVLEALGMHMSRLAGMSR